MGKRSKLEEHKRNTRRNTEEKEEG